MKEATFQRLADSQFAGKEGVDQAILDEGLKELTALIADETGLKPDNSLWVTGLLDRDNGGILVKMKVPAQRLRYHHFVEVKLADPVTADDEVAEAIKAQEQDAAQGQGNAGGDKRDDTALTQEQKAAGIAALLEREKANDPTLTDDDKAKLAAYHEANPASV